MPEMDMLGLGDADAPPMPAAEAPQGDDTTAELESHMTTLMAAMKSGQARKAANALKNFIAACGSGEEEPEGY